MQNKNGHCPEHISFPANKMIPKGILRKDRPSHVYQGGGVCLAGKVASMTAEQRRILKKGHTKRSRRYTKEELRREQDEA